MSVRRSSLSTHTSLARRGRSRQRTGYNPHATNLRRVVLAAFSFLLPVPTRNACVMHHHPRFVRHHGGGLRGPHGCAWCSSKQAATTTTRRSPPSSWLHKAHGVARRSPVRRVGGFMACCWLAACSLPPHPPQCIPAFPEPTRCAMLHFDTGERVWICDCRVEVISVGQWVLCWLSRRIRDGKTGTADGCTFTRRRQAGLSCMCLPAVQIEVQCKDCKPEGLVPPQVPDLPLEVCPAGRTPCAASAAQTLSLCSRHTGRPYGTS